MSSELDHLQQRIQALEVIEREYNGLKQLLNHAANNGNLDEYGGTAFLYVAQSTQQIALANPKALALLGYTAEELYTHRIDEIEITSSILSEDHVTYVQNSSQEYIYNCTYRHRDGYTLPMRVYQRRLNVDTADIFVQYMLEDLSLQKKLWHELSRREDPSFHFREKLKHLNEINLQLAETQSLDELCKFAIQLGMEKLDFDRLSIWLLDEEADVMVGTYGVDETGTIRDEHHSSWSYVGTHVMDFAEGKNTHFVIQQNAPIYDHQSQVIGFGWHISVPLLYRGRFIGFMAADNFINQLELKDYQPELLELYGNTIGHLAANQQAFDNVRKLSNAIHHSSSMIGILSEQAVIEFVNSAFINVSGYSAVETLGKSLSVFLPETEYQPIWQAISQGVSWKGELTQRKKNGDLYETIVALSPIKTGDGERSFVIVQEDISELKRTRKFEFDLQLEQERTRMLETFIGNIGHEFRTPLSIIRLKSYLIQKVSEEAKRDQFISEIQEQVSVISSMVDDLIYIVKLESETKQDFAPVDIKQVVEVTLTGLTDEVEKKQLQLQLQLTDLPFINGDSEKLTRAVYEIIENAIQYTPMNGELSISLNNLANEVHLRVQDTGIGIPDTEKGRIFDRLYRGDQARTKRGSGLGLSIAKLIVEAHSGMISVESTPDVGSTFEVRLPLLQAVNN